MRRFSYLLSAVLMVAVLLSPIPALAAWNPFGEVDCGDPRLRDSAVCETDGGTAPNALLLNAADILAVVAAIGAVIVIVLAGIRYITAAGDPNQVSQAKNTIIFAIVGLIIIALARSIVAIVIRGI